MIENPFMNFYLDNIFGFENKPSNSKTSTHTTILDLSDLEKYFDKLVEKQSAEEKQEQKEQERQNILWNEITETLKKMQVETKPVSSKDYPDDFLNNLSDLGRKAFKQTGKVPVKNIGSDWDLYKLQSIQNEPVRKTNNVLTNTKVEPDCPTVNLSFSQAFEYLKQGKKLSRGYWEDSSIFVYYVPENSYPSVTDVAKKEFGKMTKYTAYLALSYHKGVMPWTPNNDELFANDWYLVD